MGCGSVGLAPFDHRTTFRWAARCGSEGFRAGDYLAGMTTTKFRTLILRFRVLLP